MTAEMRELIARQNADRAKESAAVLRSLLAPADESEWPAQCQAVTTDTTSEESTS